MCRLYRNTRVNIVRPSPLLKTEENEMIGKEDIKNFDFISDLLLKRMIICMYITYKVLFF